MGKKPTTLMEVIYAHTTSFRKSARIYALITCWAAALEDTGQEELTVEQYKDWAEPEWPRRTVDRQISEFREAFPDQRTPHRFAKRFNEYKADFEERKSAPEFAVFA